MTYHFARVTSEEVLSGDGKSLTILIGVKHHADKGCKRTHIHYVLDTTLSEKDIRTYIRSTLGLNGRMDIALKPVTQVEDEPETFDRLCEYLGNHCGASIVCTDPSVVGSYLSTHVGIAIAAADAAQLARDEKFASDVAMWREQEIVERKAVCTRLGLDYDVMVTVGLWPEGVLDPIRKTYHAVRDRIELCTRYWGAANPDWTWEEYTDAVLRFITQAGDDYRFIYSEYRLKGDVKLLYAKFWPHSLVSPRIRLFGH